MPSSKPMPLSFIDQAELREQLNFIIDDLYAKLDYALSLDGKGIMTSLLYGGLGADISSLSGILFVNSGVSGIVVYGSGLSFDAATGTLNLTFNQLYNANTILKADVDNTPGPLFVDEQRIIGRITGGVIDDLTAAQVRTLLGLATTDSPAFVTTKLSALGDTYIPKNTTAGGLSNSLLKDDATNVELTGAGFHRTSTARYRRYYHIVLGAANPGASGALWVDASANTTGGWRLTNAAWLLRGQADVHSDWDGASDMMFSVNFMVNVDNTAGGVGDTVDLKVTAYYKGVGDTACKSQSVEVATVVGQSAQYKQFKANFTFDYDYALNVIEAGDVIALVLNLETDSSEVDDIVVTSMEFYYNTKHIGLESGDV